MPVTEKHSHIDRDFSQTVAVPGHTLMAEWAAPGSASTRVSTRWHSHHLHPTTVRPLKAVDSRQGAARGVDPKPAVCPLAPPASLFHPSFPGAAFALLTPGPLRGLVSSGARWCLLRSSPPGHLDLAKPARPCVRACSCLGAAAAASERPRTLLDGDLQHGQGVFHRVVALLCLLLSPPVLPYPLT